MSPGGFSVRVDRVVAVVATLKGGREQIGSGYLVSGRLVLTAEHCTRDKGQVTGEPVAKARLRVIRASDGAVADVADMVADRVLDVAVLQLADNAPWDAGLPPPPFAGVDQSQSGMLDDCTGIGFPLFQRDPDPDRRTRHTSEFHGTVYQTDEREDGHLLMREPRIRPGPVADPQGETRSEPGEEGPSPWGGMSGALMFYRGTAIGVVVEHHPRQGDSALRAIGFERIAADSAAIRQCLGLPGPDSLPCVSEQTAARLIPAGWPLDEVRDPFALEVHRPVQPEDPQPGLPVLPAYVPRDHDVELATVVRAAAEGSSGIAVLVGGSSTGKTRACWEALGLLRDQDPPWRLWHPIDPSRPDAALRELPVVGPRTVVWLNEAQLYLDTADGLGERVAAGLRELLRDPARAPVLVLAALWPRYWDELTAHPAGGADLHAQARELLDGHDITVPAAFTAAQLQRLSQAGDARLAQAAAEAQDGQVIQFLAGVPELLARYGHAPPAAAALIHAAMDARRLGTGIALPQAFLEASAPPPGYLTDDEWDAQDDDWLEQALTYAAKDANGARGPLTRIRPRPARPGATGFSSSDSDERATDGQASTPRGPLYRLADYLDQHGRTDRKGQIPPAGFWAAAADYAFPADQAALGDAADARGLYRAAAQLYKNAARRGNPRAVTYLTGAVTYSTSMPCLRADVRPLGWAAAHASLENPGGVADLLDKLREAGTPEQVTALLGRNPAAHASLDDPHGVASLLDKLQEAGADEQVTALADRAAAHPPLDDPAGAIELLRALREVGAHEQVTALADRAAAHAPLDDPGDVARLLDGLREAGADEQAAALLGRDPAAHASLENPAGGVASLLHQLREAGADEQAAALLGRDPAAHASLENPLGVIELLRALREVGAHEQVTALADRAAAHASLENPYEVVDLLDGLREAGASEQAAALADRAAAHASVEYPGGVASLLVSLMRSGTLEQVTALADRAAAHASLENSGGMASLLDAVRAAGMLEPVTALLRRDPAAHASLENPYGVARLLASLRTAATPEQVTALADRAVAHVSLEDPGGVARLLAGLREAGADEQAAALLGRDPAAHVSLEDSDGMASLLHGLREAGADEQAAALLGRDPAAHVSLESSEGVARLLAGLREAGADEQAAALLGRDPAAHVSLEDSDGMASLLAGLREAGAPEQAAALLGRDPAAHVSLEDSDGMASLLHGLREAGAPEQVTALADRVAAHAPLENPGGVVRLLRTLREVGADEQVTALADRAVAHVSLEYLWGVVILLAGLRAAGADEQVTALADRAAAHAPLEDPGDVASLLGTLWDSPEHAAPLLHRDPAAHVSVDDPAGVARLLDALREAGAPEQVTALADRAAAHASLDNPGDVARLLGTLWDSPEQVAALLRRDPAAHVFLDDPASVARLLDQLRGHGAPEQVAALLRRDPAAHVFLDDTVVSLLDELREAGASGQVTALAGRLPGAGMFELFRRQRDPQDQFRFGREVDGSPAKPWDWGDLD